MSPTPLGKRQWNSTWAGLPGEIRLLIFQALIRDGCPLSPWVTVSDEWRRVLEPYSFADMRVTPDNLEEFACMTRRARPLVRYIWFCVELDEYDYSSRRSTWSCAGNTDCDLVRAALGRLFLALSTWEASGDLTLDISIYSPSDAGHWFKYVTILPDVPSGDEVTEMELDRYYDQVYERASETLYSVTPSMAILQAFRTKMPLGSVGAELQWLKDLPMVPAVTKLRLRQQSRWRWISPSLGHMLTRFPGLEEIHYEPWRNWGTRQEIDDIGNGVLLSLLSHCSRNLKRVAIFENFNQQYPAIIQRDLSIFNPCDSFRKPCREVALNMAFASRGLEHLAASFMVDASHYFAAIQPDWRWPNLTSLVLTSTWLSPDENAVELGALLRAAAETAMRMPRLETMEIWNGRKGLAALFRYQASRARRQATISWRSTWDLALDADTMRAWNAVFQHHDENWELFVYQQRLDEAAIKSHGDAIFQLGLLSSNIIRPISWRQIQFEQKALEGLPTVE